MLFQLGLLFSPNAKKALLDSIVRSLVRVFNIFRKQPCTQVVRSFESKTAENHIWVARNALTTPKTLDYGVGGCARTIRIHRCDMCHTWMPFTLIGAYRSLTRVRRVFPADVDVRVESPRKSSFGYNSAIEPNSALGFAEFENRWYAEFNSVLNSAAELVHPFCKSNSAVRDFLRDSYTALIAELKYIGYW